MGALHSYRKEYIMQAFTKVGFDALLTPENCVLLLVDHQPFQLANVHSHEPTMVINNVTALAKTAKIYGIPTILTTVNEERGGMIFKAGPGSFSGSENDQPHFHQLLGRSAGRRGGEEGGPEEAGHSRTLDGDVSGNARYPRDG
jgi:hypothetical protein